MCNVFGTCTTLCKCSTRLSFDVIIYDVVQILGFQTLTIIQENVHVNNSCAPREIYIRDALNIFFDLYTQPYV